MRQISELRDTLMHSLEWNKARITCLIQILHGLFIVRTVNLTQIAQAFQDSAKEESRYRRIQRFFTGFSFDMSFIVLLACRLFTWKEKVILIMDRTTWSWGKTEINILMVSIEHCGIGIPVFWMVLNKGGNSSTRERIFVLQRFFRVLGKEKIHVLLADREFIGEAWFRFLIEEEIPFVIRIKQNFLVEGLRQGYAVPAGELLKKLDRKKSLTNQSIILWNHSLYASVEYAKGAKEPMIIVSNRPFSSPVELYRCRWSIETLFGCLKSRGFRLEETHMTDDKKIEKLLFILAIAMCWAYKIGELKARKKCIVIKKHGRKLKSVFRLGLDLIRQALFNKDESLINDLSVFSSLRMCRQEGCGC